MRGRGAAAPAGGFRRPAKPAGGARAVGEDDRAVGPQGRHAGRRDRLCRDGRPRRVRRMAARTRAARRSRTPDRAVRADRARRGGPAHGLLSPGSRQRYRAGADAAGDRRRRRALESGAAEHSQCGAHAVRVRLSRDHPLARDDFGRVRRFALRRVLPGPVVARFLRLGVPARQDREHRGRQRQQGLLAAGRGRDDARRSRPR